MTLVSAFERYEYLFLHLATLVNNWASSWRTLDIQAFRENYLKETVSKEEKEKLENQIAKLEIDIDNCEKDILNLIHIIENLLSQSFVYDFNIINSVNRYHINAMQQYSYIINLYEKTRDEYIGKDVNVDFTKLENSKRKLNKKIIEFNAAFVGDNKVGLLTVKEAQTLADKETMDILKKRI